MYDHLYQRGYVENILDGNYEDNGIPMCSCIESMPPGKSSKKNTTER